MTDKEAIEYFETVRTRNLKHLRNCQSKPNRTPSEESNLKKKLEAVTLAINSIRYVSKKKIDSSKWMSDLLEASWED